MIYFVNQCLWIAVLCSSSNQYDEKWINEFEKSKVYKSFEAVQKLPDSDFENILRRLVITTKYECSPEIFNEYLLFKKSITDVYFGNNCQLTKQIIFNIYTKQEFEEDTCYYGANFKLISNFINMWVEFYQNEEIWKKKHSIKDDDILKVYLFEEKLNRVKEYYNIELRIEPMTYLPLYVKLVFYEYLIFILKFKSRVDIFKKKLGPYHKYTEKITSLKKSYLEDIHKLYSLEDEVLIRFSSFSYMQSTVFINPFDFAKRSGRFNQNNTDIEKCCLKSGKIKINTQFILNCRNPSQTLSFETENELEFYFQIFHYFAEVENIPIYVSLQKVGEKWNLHILTADYIPYSQIWRYVLKKNDRTKEFVDGNISKDICTEYNGKNKTFIKFNGVSNSSEGSLDLYACFGLSCGHILRSRNLTARLYVDVNNYTINNDKRIERCPICLKRVKTEFALRHYQ